MQIGIGWLGLSEWQVERMTFWAIEQGYEGRLDMIRDVLKAVFPPTDKNGRPLAGQAERLPATKENILAVLRASAGPFKKVPKP